MRIISKFFEGCFYSDNVPVSLGNGENVIYPKCVWLLTVFVKKKLPEQLGLHCYALCTHPDELVFEPEKMRGAGIEVTQNYTKKPEMPPITFVGILCKIRAVLCSKIADVHDVRN